MPCAETPTVHRVPRSDATARAWRVEISCVWMPDTGAGDGVAGGVGDDLLEARLVHRLPRGGGLHEAVQPGRERLRRALVRSEADHRLDALQADAGQGDAGELRPSPRPH